MTDAPQFTDNAGRTWRLLLTIGMARRIRDSLGVDFGKVQDGQAFLQMAADPFLFVAVLYVICEAQAEQMQVTPEEFGESLTGDASDAAYMAMQEAVIHFTRAPMRPAVRKILSGAMEAVEQGLEAIADQTVQQIPQILQRAQREADMQINRRSGS